MKTLKSLLLGALLGISAVTSAADFKAGSGVFLLNGKPFYGVGVNYQDGFMRYANSQWNTTWKAGLATLKTYNVPFIRINAIGFWPSDIQRNFVNNKTVFYSRLDEFMNEAAKNNVGVILDIFWNWTSFSDINNEKVPAWGDTNSATRKFMRAVTTEMVTRYKNHPALWGWEFANEATAAMDLPASVKNYQWLPLEPGRPARDAGDTFTVATILNAMDDFARTVRINDTTHPIFSGNDRPRNNAANLPTSWNIDTTTQYGQTLTRDNQRTDTTTIHLYPYGEFSAFGADPVTKVAPAGNYANILTTVANRSRLKDSTGKLIDPRPLFLGEFGASDKDLGAAGAKTKFKEITDSILANKIPLSALWVFDYAGQEGSYNVTATNSRSYMLDRVKEMNATMATWK